MLKQLEVYIISVNTVSSITFVLYSFHFCVCTFDHIPMLKCAIEVSNIIIIIIIIIITIT